jgi:transcriptional regulator with XRE-family HTH domain
MQSDGKQIFVSLGNEIRTRRKKRGLTQQELSENVGIHRTYLADVERGCRNVSLYNICRIATGLEVSVAELFSSINTRVEESPALN